MSAAQAAPDDLQALVANDPVISRRAEAALRAHKRLPDRALRNMLGRDPWDSVPRAARLAAATSTFDQLYDLLFDEDRGRGASQAFRFVPRDFGPGLGPLLADHRGVEPPYTLIRAVGEHADARDAPYLADEARARKFRDAVVGEVVTALERMVLAQAEERDATIVFEQLQSLLDEIQGSPFFSPHPSWHVFRLESAWLTPVMQAFGKHPEARVSWSGRALTWLGISRARRAVDFLGRVAASPDEPTAVRVAAVEALAQNAQEGALQAVARAATAVAGDDPGLPAALDAASAQLAWQSSDAANLARDGLARAVETRNTLALAHSLYALGRAGSAEDVETAEGALVHDEWQVRAAAGVALAELEGPEAVLRLRKALDEAGEPIERLQLTTALALANPEGYLMTLHETLCTREVTSPWALIDPFRQAIGKAFTNGPPDLVEHRDAWREVLRLQPLILADRPPHPSTKAPPAPVADRITPEPGRGTPNAQADAEAIVDRLGRAPLVTTVAGMLDAPDQGTPFTFGLFGGWGEGKSSVLRQLERQLKSDDMTHEFLVSWFNAWQYERTDNLAAGLVQETVRSLIPERRRDRLALAWRFAWRMHGSRLRSAFVALLLAAVATGLGLVAGWINENVAKAILGAGGVSVLAAITTVVVRLYRHPVASQLWTYFRLPDYAEHLGLLPVMREQLSVLWAIRSKARHGRPRRLVVVVDDLDRCSPAAIAATLDAVRLVMDLRGVAVIVALDERICLRAVAEEYESLTTPERSSGAIARDFLAKIVQLPIRLEPPDSLEEFLKHELFADGNGPSSQPAATGNGGAGSGTTTGHTAQPRPGAAPAGPDEREALAHEATRKAEGTYSEAAVRAGASRLTREGMRDTPAERAEFERLARAAGIHNPRQLRRLRNTYRFIKPAAGHLDWRKVMVMLFWQDCLHMLPSDVFAAHAGLPVDNPPGIEKALFDVTVQVFDDEADFIAHRDVVLLAILPRLDVPAAAHSQA